jgi:hypothetical protein
LDPRFLERGNSRPSTAPPRKTLPLRKHATLSVGQSAADAWLGISFGYEDPSYQPILDR